MKKEDWLEAFEAINGRKPSSEEFFTAKENGEFLEDNSNEKIETVLVSEESPEIIVKTQERYTNEQVVFCQNCGTENIQVNRACHKCGTDLLTSHNKNAENPIMNSNLFTYLKYCINNGKRRILFFLVPYALLTLAPFISLFNNNIGYSYSSISIFDAKIFSILLWSFPMYTLSRKGQNLFCRLIGAKPIERLDHRELVTQPIENIIKNARARGLNLPKNVEIHLIKHELPIAYAVGMNRIVVSESLLGEPDYLESKIMFELNRIHNQSPNVLLLVIGSNIILVLLCLIVMGVSAINKNYGDSRKSFWTGSSQRRDGAILFYTVLAIFAGILGLTALFVGSVVKRDIELSDRYVASLGMSKTHISYLENISKIDNSLTNTILEFGFPDIDSRIAILQQINSTVRN
ncbi:TPA: zinc ribbon domain-containing protein [Streptococcus suis]